MLTRKPSVLGGSLIVAGTGVGAGMLGMPVATGLGGFFASVIFYVVCYLTMIATGLIFVEIDLWIKDERTNFLSIAEKFLGKVGKVVIGVIYIGLFYSLLVGYIAGIGKIFSPLVPYFIAMVGTVVILAPLILKGTFMIDRINQIFMLGLFGFYGLFIIFGFGFVQPGQLLHFDFLQSLPGLPVVFTAFSFQGTVPSLVNYLQRDPAKVRSSIIWGSTIALGIYLVWQALILGIVPIEGPGGLLAAQTLGETAVFSLYQITGNQWFFLVGQGFAICAIITSFLGINMGLIDFIADGMRLQKRGKELWLIGALTFLPPLICALIYPGAFLIALKFAGGIGCVLLLGVFPIVALTIGRYVRSYIGVKVFPLGKVALGSILVFLLFVFAISLQ